MGDYLSIYDGSDIQSQQISKLDRRLNYDLNLNKKSVSSSGSHMLVQFVTDNELNLGGFSAKIYYTPINPICKGWLNINSSYLTSPDSPTVDCSWVITKSMGSTISIQFHTFEVK